MSAFRLDIPDDPARTIWLLECRIAQLEALVAMRHPCLDGDLCTMCNPSPE